MGLFDWLKKKKPAEAGGAGAPAPEPDPEPAAEPEPEAAAVVLVREGMSPPSDEDMAAVLRAHAPELLELPRRGLSQPRWWRQDDWLASGMRGVGAALAKELSIDAEKTTWRVVRDDKGARVGIVRLHR